jgi:hypothetical protein
MTCRGGGGWVVLLRLCHCVFMYEKAERELARAMAIGKSLQMRREVLDEAEQVCSEVINMIKVSAAAAAAAAAAIAADDIFADQNS